MRHLSHRHRLILLTALYAGLALVAHATGKPDASAAKLSDAGGARIRTTTITAPFDELHGRCTRADGHGPVSREKADRCQSSLRVDELRAHLDGAGLSAPRSR